MNYPLSEKLLGKPEYMAGSPNIQNETEAFYYAEDIEKVLEKGQAKEIAPFDEHSTVHSCHDKCQRLPCVQRREITKLQSDLDKAKAALKKIAHTIGKARDDHGSPNKFDLCMDRNDRILWASECLAELEGGGD